MRGNQHDPAVVEAAIAVIETIARRRALSALRDVTRNSRARAGAGLDLSAAGPSYYDWTALSASLGETSDFERAVYRDAFVRELSAAVERLGEGGAL